MPAMPSFTALDAKIRERRRQNAGKRVLETMERMTAEAAKNGLTEKDLEELLRDDS